MHAMIILCILDGVVTEQIETTQLLDKVPVLYILLIVLGILELLMVKSSGIMRIKMFAKNKKTNAANYLVPGAYNLCVGWFYKTGYIVCDYKKW